MTLPPSSPFGRAFLPGLALTLGMLFAVSRAPGSPPFFTAVFGLIGVAYLPGLAAALWVENRFGLWSSWILPLILSPVLAVGAALLLGLSGVPIDATSPWIVFLAVLAVAAAPQPKREIEDWTVSLEMPGFLRRRSDRQQVLFLAAVVLVLLAAPLLTRDWIRTTGDAALQLASTRNVLFRGLPPQDPFLAGMPLRAFWAFPVYLAVLQGATRLSAELLMVGGSLIAAFVLVFTAYRLLTLLGLSHARAIWGAVFLFFSLGGAFWIVLPAMAATGHGALPFGAALGRRLSLTDPGAGFPPLSTFFLERFFIAGPFVMALVYMLLFVTSTVATLGENRMRWNLLAFLAAMGMLLFHGGVGVVALAVTLISIPVVWLTARLNPFRGAGAELSGVLVPSALAALVTAPYLAYVLRAGPFDPGRYLDLSLSRTAVMGAALLPDLALGAAVLVRFLDAPEVRRQAWTVWTIVLLAVALVAGFPGEHPAMGPILLAHVPLAMTAGASVPTLWQRRGTAGKVLLALLLFLILVPRTWLGIAAYLHADDPRDLRPETVEVESWLRDRTPPDAVLVDGSAQLALASGRVLYFPGSAHLRRLGYAGHEMDVRRLTFLGLLQGQPLLPEEERSLAALRAPVYVVCRLPEAARRPPPPDSEEAFRNPSYVVYRWLGGEAGREGER